MFEIKSILMRLTILFILLLHLISSYNIRAQNKINSENNSQQNQDTNRSYQNKDFNFSTDTDSLISRINEMKQSLMYYKTRIAESSAKGAFSNAIFYQEKLMGIQDSIAQLEKIVALTKLQLQFEAEQSENEIKLMNVQNESQLAFLERQKLQRYGFLAGGIFLVLFIFGLISRLRFLHKAKLKMEVQHKKISTEKQRAEKNEKIREQFLSKMSHEIRTPLSSIMGMSHLLKKNKHLKEQDKYLDAIWKSSENLLVILNDILDLSRLESGKVEIEKVAFYPIDELLKLRELLKYKAEEKGVDLQCDLQEEIPKVLIGDPVRLNQILLNLTGNAIKFTEKGSIRVSVGLKEIIDKKAVLKCTIKDTGIGIPKDRLEKIFESFTQADSQTTRKYGGTGLGLTITKQLLLLQNGNISVKSTPGKGSVFTFTIPFEIGEEEEVSSKKTEAPEKKLKGLKVLLVEDNEFNIMLVSAELKDFIARVHIDLAENGKVAVNKVIAHDYDLILMDIEMSEMNGYEAAKAIRKMNAPKNKVPIIAMTANAMKDDVQKCYDAGMNEFISKPFNPEDLRDKVHFLIGNKA